MTQARMIDRQIAQEPRSRQSARALRFLAVLMACLGLYGTMAYTVARRTGEIGIRVALGAQRRSVIWMVMREVLMLAGVALAIGIPAPLSASRRIETFLFQMKPRDPLAISASAVILLAAAIAAGYGPAWRASRVDPMAALRHE
jgi:ABC-type antimicrobial peptide transport system permease subunit